MTALGVGLTLGDFYNISGECIVQGSWVLKGELMVMNMLDSGSLSPPPMYFFLAAADRRGTKT